MRRGALARPSGILQTEVVAPMNMTRFVAEHDRFVRTQEPSPRLIAYHREQIAFVHRERTVHLAVTLAMALFFLLSVGWTSAQPSLAGAVLSLLLLALLVPYLLHYYRLENKVQEWHLLLLRLEGFGPHGGAEQGEQGAAAAARPDGAACPQPSSPREESPAP